MTNEAISVTDFRPTPITTAPYMAVVDFVRAGNMITVNGPSPRTPRSVPFATADMQEMRTESSAERVMTSIPYEASPLPLDIEEELHLQFPPKSVRVVQGKVTRRERAIFRSELLDQTLVE